MSGARPELPWRTGVGRGRLGFVPEPVAMPLPCEEASEWFVWVLLMGMPE